ncbi:MAG TPA: gamma-glutamyltransferase [Bryobacteraceae bacterium]|nr:gamma-glutamyltransferase [Bryobacteraceae bacterium]HPU70718.1 gamma-glutamyltransferase [Bryobacteraceae bacterium]
MKAAIVAMTVATTALAAQPQRLTMRPVIRGTQYAVVSMKPEATQAAERILRAGGNAFDAAVAGQAVLAIVDMHNNGVGSDAVLLVYDAKTGKVVSINAEGTAPKLATIEWYKANQGGKLPVDDTLLAGTVPGVVDAWYILLDRWGTMTFAEVLAPAIEIAERGFPLSESVAHAMAKTEKLRKYPSTVKVLFPDGREPQAGQVWRNPQLARTLRRLVEAERAAAGQGRRAALKAARDRFYKGDIAREMARFSEENGGLFRYEDFAEYTAKIEEPVFVDYRGYRVHKNPSATQAPTELFILNLLEGYDLKALKLNSAEYLHISAEAAKLAFADRDKYLGDMDFITIPYKGLLSKEYARERRKLIDENRASPELRPGVPEKFAGMEPLERPLDYTIAEESNHEGDTSYIAVVDKDRNVVSFTPSLHMAFGTGVFMGELGFSFNCRGDYFSLVPGTANALAPGKRPRSTLQSSLVTKDGKPVMALGSPGGDDQCLRTMQTFLNIVEFGMDVQQAIEAPRWTSRAFPSSPFPHVVCPNDLGLEDRIPQEVRDALSAKGHKARVEGPWSIGSNGAIVIDPETGVLSAGADPRVDAYALAW